MSGAQIKAHTTKDALNGKYPQFTNWDADIKKITLDQMLTLSTAENAEKTAISFMGNDISYLRFQKLVDDAARGLVEMGVKKDTKVGLHMPNTPYYPIMFFAILKAGGTVVNFSPLYNQDELAAQIDDSDTEIMVTMDLKDFLDKNLSLQEQGKLKKVVRCDLDKMLPFPKSFLFKTLKSKDISSRKNEQNENVVSFDALLSQSEDVVFPENDPSDLAVLQYTGGTTGVPKGAMLTHFNLVSNAYQIDEFFGHKASLPENALSIRKGQEKVLGTLPYFHVYGMMTSMISSLQMGNQILMLPNPRDIPATLKAIDKEKPTLAPLVPRLVQALDEHPKSLREAWNKTRGMPLLKRIFNAISNYPWFRRFDLSSIRAVVSGGAALPTATGKSFEAMVGRQNIILQGYGLSETSPVAASNPGYGANRMETVGLPYPNTELRITDPEDPSITKNTGETGEICIRGPQVFKGYYKKPEETAGVLTEDGWFRTGDLGHLDEHMYLQITDRKKRMIIVNGENVYPAQIENKITDHPSVAECVVIGLPDESAGEAAKVYIRYRDDAAEKPDEQALRAWLSNHLHKLEMPKFFEFVSEELPKTAVGKPDWKTLQDAERARLSKQSENLTHKIEAPAPS